MSTAFDPGKTAFSRVFIIPGRARPDHKPWFQSCMKAGAPSQGFGDVEPIQCPDPNEYGEFVEVGQIQGAVERATLTLTGRYASDLESALLVLAKARCPADVQVHFGKCTDPSDFDTFTKAILLENAALTNWSADDLGALSSDENAQINESTDLSIELMYEVLQLSFSERADDITLNEVLDVVICDRVSCGDCEDESFGCEKIYSLSGATGGSPGTAPDVIYSIDKGLIWALDEVNSLIAAEPADALACQGDYLVVVSNASNSLHWKTKADVNSGVVDAWIEQGVGFQTGGEPNDIWSVGTYSFIVGDAGYVYGTVDPTLGVTVLDATIATDEDLRCVHALDEEFAVAGGDNGALIYTQNQVTWQSSPATPVGVGVTITGVWVKREEEWWVVTDAGTAWYTLDQGSTWVQKALPGTVTGLHDIAFATDSVGGIVGHYLGQNVRAWRTYDGGYSWVALPEGSGNLPTGRDLNALALCSDDPNFMVLVGEGANFGITEYDGIIIVGED